MSGAAAPVSAGAEAYLRSKATGSKYSHILWDFNGTVLDDVDIGIECVNALLERRGLPVIENRRSYFGFFCFPIQKYYEKLGFDFRREPYDVLAHEWVSEYLVRSPRCGLCDGVYGVISEVSRRGIPQYILSATEKTMLTRQLDALGLTGFFTQVLGLDNIYAASKAALACEWTRVNNPEHAVLIGDTEHDCETAFAAGMDCLLVASGHSPREKLERLGVPVFGNAAELLENGVIFR